MSRNSLIGLVLCLAAGDIVADTSPQIPVEAFFSFPKVADVKISPDGKYLALIIADPKTGEDRKALVLMTTDSTHKVTGSFSVVGYQEIVSFWWTTNDRILAATATQTGSFAPPLWDGQLFAINADGTKQMRLMPSTTGTQHLVGGTAHDKEMIYFFGMLRRNAEDPEHALIYGATYGLNNSYDQIEQVYSLDVDTGALRLILQSPLANGDFVVDNEGNVRIATGENQNTGAPKAVYRADDSSHDWKDLSDLYKGDDPAEVETGPAGFMTDDRSLYWYGRTSTSTIGLYSLNPDTMKMEELYSDTGTDINDLVWSFDWMKPQKVIAIGTMPGLPQVHILDADDPKAQTLASLYQAFEGQIVEITSNTVDGSLMIVKVSSDKNPGDFYLFNAKTNEASFLFNSKPDIDPKVMAAMQPVEFQARDGLKLNGYLTLPPMSSGKNLPLIINPHGGPHGIRDEWGWSWSRDEVQFFASHGYAVLQVNYRGSGGYGMKFQDLGYQHWGTTMQDDLADAVSWAVRQGIADPQRVCIYGASYGGYAALENAVRYPDLYKCAVGYAGVYDIGLLGREGDTHHYASGKHFLDVVHGTDEVAMKEYSPAFNADKIKAAVFLIYGGEDHRVVPQHAEELMAAMDKAGKKYEKLYEASEVHGFYKPEHRFEAYRQMLQFFDKYIGPDAAKSNVAQSTQTNKAP